MSKTTKMLLDTSKPVVRLCIIPYKNTNYTSKILNFFDNILKNFNHLDKDKYPYAPPSTMYPTVNHMKYIGEVIRV